MSKKLLLIAFAIIIGCLSSYYILFFSRFSPYSHNSINTHAHAEVIGFLPYSLISRAKKDYSGFITTLSYFALSLDRDGSIVKLKNEQEEDPGWYTLHSGKASENLNEAIKNNISLSLVVADGDNTAIDSLITEPTLHAQNLIHDVLPIMDTYGFTDLNVDIESTKIASDGAQRQFITFIQTVHHALQNNKKTLTIDISTADLINDHDLINPKAIEKYADTIVIMGYDYHSTASFVTGPIGPLFGAGTQSEYDVSTAVQRALRFIPRNKIILGIPLYGYEWETLQSDPRSAIIPNSGGAASNRRIETILDDCASCSAKTDSAAQESYLSYFDESTYSFHQFFYPTAASTQAKIEFVKAQQLRGLALWALGYEGKTILNPLQPYLSE